MNNRDMFYNNYGYFNEYPMQMNPNIIPQQVNPFLDIHNRISKLEKQINIINERINRLETPNNKIYNEPDNNLYML